jgi:oxygen-dependent protoporphyrinogen oxidase
MELSSESTTQLEVLLFEGRNKLGGVISTKRAYDFLIEEGPDSFITTKPWALNLSGDCLSPELTTNEENRRVRCQTGKTYTCLMDFMLAPTRLLSFLTSVIYMARKLQKALETVLADPAKVMHRTSATRRFSESARSWVQPLISGITLPITIPEPWAFPQFLNWNRSTSVLRVFDQKNKNTLNLVRGAL